MSVYFEELDFRPTAMGVLSLRRRRQLSTGIDVYEIKLGDEFLMSSLFTVAEIALARLGLARAAANRPRCGRWRARAWLHRAGGAGRYARAVAHRGRCVGRGDRVARARSASARRATDGGSALPLRQWRLLRDVGIHRWPRSANAGPPLRCGAGGYRSFAAQPAASASRGAVRSRRACEGLPDICIPAACSRCGRTIRRMRHSRPCWPSVFATSDAHVVTFDNPLQDRDASNTVYIGVKASLPL